MPSEPCISAYALRIPVLLIALTTGVDPAGAQRVSAALGLAAEPGYVSRSGALTFGFSQYLKEHPGWSADPVGMMPSESQIPGICRQLLNDMWQGSPTFRRQWTRLAAARVRVSLVLNPMLNGWTRAHAQLSRTPDLRVRSGCRSSIGQLSNTWHTRLSTCSRRWTVSIWWRRWHRGFMAPQRSAGHQRSRPIVRSQSAGSSRVK
jgi:hypothetical protein